MITMEKQKTKKLTGVARTISVRIGKAIGDYNMIENGDKILVGVSGGKDSLTLLSLLKARQKWSPVKYEIVAAHINTDFACSSCTHNDVLEKMFKEMNIQYAFRKIKVLTKEKTTNCFWCSWNRRKAFFEIAEELGCNKIALGHHKDDVVETMLLNLIFQGEISTMNPMQEMFKGKISIIRPLCYVEEDMTAQFAKDSGFLSVSCQCPFGQNSQRQYIKKFIRETQEKIPGTNIKTNIFKSLARIKAEYINLIDR